MNVPENKKIGLRGVCYTTLVSRSPIFLFSIFNFRSLSYLAYLLQFFLVDNFDFSSVNGNQAFRSKL